MKILSHPSLLAVLLLTAGISVSAMAHARYLFPQIKDVPVKRLIANLERQIEEQPNEHHLRLNLARAHAMAFALNSDNAKVGVMDRGNGINFWRVPSQYSNEMPHHVTNTPSAAARDHLSKAIKLYDSILNEQPDGDKAYRDYIVPVARLGRAWCLEQSGDKDAAIAGYRMLVKHTLSEGALAASGVKARQPSPGVDWSDAAAEAAEYLIALLDPKRDAAEIASLREQSRQFASRPRLITPIAIPLSPGTQLSEMEDANARVAFDVDASQTGRHWSWITPNAGWLIYDPRKTGNIDSGIRLFGNVTFWMFWQNGYQALAMLDDNHDGILDVAELAGIGVWVDRNRDGICDPGEIASLADLNITALRYAHIPLPNHPDRIVYAPQGVQFKSGSSAASYDIVLHPQP